MARGAFSQPSVQARNTPSSRPGAPRFWVFALAFAVLIAVVGAMLTFTGAGKPVIMAVYNFLEFYSGVFSLVSLSIAVMVGLAATDRIVLMVRHRVLLQAVHRATASTAMIFLGIHIFTKIVEGHASVVDVVVPFLASHKVLYIGLGTLASYLMILVTWTGVIRGRFAGSAHPGLWRAVHASAYLSWVFALFHGLESGRAAKTWVIVSYVVCVLLVGLALLVRLSVSWGRRMRSPKATTTGTIKAIGKPVSLRSEPSLRSLARDEPLAPVGRALDDLPPRGLSPDDDPFGGRPLGDEPSGRHTIDDAWPSGRRARGDDTIPGRRAARGGDRRAERDRPEMDTPLTLEGPGVEWYDEDGNHSFTAGPAFSRRSDTRGSGARGSHAARDEADDAPVSGQPLPPLSYLDGTPGHRLEPEVRYQPPEEEPSFPESAYQGTTRDDDDPDDGRWPSRSVTGGYRQVRRGREGSRRDGSGREGWDRDSWGQLGPDRDSWERDDPAPAGDRDRADLRGHADAGNQRGYQDTTPHAGPDRPRLPRTPVDDLMVPEPAEPPKRRRRSLAELPAGPSAAAEPAPGKPAEDISDEEFWAHMRGDVLR